MRRDPGEARLLGLWTAGCLFVLLLAGLLWVGDLSLQWPVLLVPLVWGLVAARPRRRPPRPQVADEQYPASEQRYPATDQYHPVTREAPTLPQVPPERPRRGR